jgi:acyl carrier protein
MISSNEIHDVLSELFGVPKENISDEMTMQDSNDWDSLKHMELISIIENKYKVTLSMDEIVSMVSVKGINNVLSKKMD